MSRLVLTVVGTLTMALALPAAGKRNKPPEPPAERIAIVRQMPAAKTDAPKSGEKVPPVEPSPKLPPKVAPVPPVATSDELRAAITKLNGYESTYGRKAGDPIHYQFRSPGPTDADLETLRPLLLKSAAPVQLNLNQCASVTDAGVAHLKGVTALRGLSLGGTKVTDEGMKHIGGLTELTQLSLGGTKVTDEGMKHIGGLTELTQLYIASDAISDAGVTHLSKLLKLRTLTITGKAITAAAFVHFADMTELEGIQAGSSDDFDDAKLKHMAKMTRLKTLSLAGPGLTDAGMASLKGMSELRELRIDGEKTTAAGVANLAGLTKLQKLTVFKGPGFKGAALAALAGMKELRELEFIYAPSLDKAGGEHLGKLTGLKKLRLSRVAPDGLSSITAMTGLEELTLLYTDVNDDGLKYIGKHTGLKDLSLYATRITDAGLAHLSGMTALRELDLSENRQLTDAALVAAAAIPNLESLRVSNCTKIAGLGLKNLAGHAKLKELWVNGDPITDASALVLKDLKTLERLDLAGTKVSDEVALEIKVARPKARILDASSTEVSLNKPAPPRPTPKGEDLAKVDADFTLTAEAFQKEYAADKAAAEKKYKGKVIELSGTVQTVGRVGGDTPYVGLKAGKEILGVVCLTADSQPWGKAVAGQAVKMKGRWPNDAFGLALARSVFTDVGVYKGIAITAAELGREFAADRAGTIKKYEGKHLVLSGEVATKEFNSAGAAGILFKSEGMIAVKCSFTASEKDLTKPIKAGQKLTVVGEFTLNFETGDDVTVYFCHPLTRQ